MSYDAQYFIAASELKRLHDIEKKYLKLHKPGYGTSDLSDNLLDLEKRKVQKDNPEDSVPPLMPQSSVQQSDSVKPPTNNPDFSGDVYKKTLVKPAPLPKKVTLKRPWYYIGL